MADQNSVKVIEICRVAPQPQAQQVPSHTDTQEFLHELTFFDLLWVRFRPSQRIFFYELPPSSHSTPLFFDSILPKLKASLSLTLQHFLPLAGNLTWPQSSHKPILNYVRGDTVSLTIAQYSNHHADYFNHLSSGSEFVEAREYHPFVPKLAISHEKAAAMAVQITHFPNRGFSIGTSMHHAVLDGKSSTLFFKSWAHLCKHGGFSASSSNQLPDQLKPFYGKMVINDRAGLEPIFLNQFLNSDRPNNRSLMCTIFRAPLPPDFVRGTFEFTSTKIEALRHLVIKKKQQQYQSLHLSTFSLTCAYAWVCLAKTEEIEGDKIVMIFSVDCRSRLDPPLPSNYFGNCLAGRAVVAERKGLLGEDGLVLAVNAITEVIKGLDKGLLNGAENWISTLYRDMQSTDVRVLTIVGSNRFQLYDTDFGWGRPKRTEVASIDKSGPISLSDSKNGGGGVEIGLVLKKQYMDAFAALLAKDL
ncbi:unnamed protein product [Prunus armeniaca]